MSEDIHPIRAARLAKGLSLRKGAKALKVSGGWQILRWENGEHIPTAMYAEVVAEVLGFKSAEEVQQLCREWQKRNVKGP